MAVDIAVQRNSAPLSCFVPNAALPIRPSPNLWASSQISWLTFSYARFDPSTWSWFQWPFSIFTWVTDKYGPHYLSGSLFGLDIPVLCTTLQLALWRKSLYTCHTEACPAFLICCSPTWPLCTMFVSFNDYSLSQFRLYCLDRLDLFMINCITFFRLFS